MRAAVALLLIAAVGQAVATALFAVAGLTLMVPSVGTAVCLFVGWHRLLEPPATTALTLWVGLSIDAQSGGPLGPYALGAAVIALVARSASRRLELGSSPREAGAGLVASAVHTLTAAAALLLAQADARPSASVVLEGVWQGRYGMIATGLITPAVWFAARKLCRGSARSGAAAP